ncbi:MAG: 1,2-phenylacetyl-CoA epoxidase subunit PaaC [Ferruginibacter sp.]
MSSLLNYTLHLADNNLILAQRNGEWCAHGPILEQDIAITNITLDLIGQARNFYQYAAELFNNTVLPELKNPEASPFGGGLEGVTEDSLAYLRTEREFKNCLMVELPNGDWAQTVLRQFLFSVYQYQLYEQLSAGKDAQLAAIAEKSLKEVTYHVKWSGDWVIRLGDGTEESHQRITDAVSYLWMYTGELFENADFEKDMQIDNALLQTKWLEKVRAVFEEAAIELPGETFMQGGGKQGRHTEHLGFLLTELQYLQRTYPGAEW